MVENHKEKTQNLLFIFDMDFTILEENTDYEIRDLISKEELDEIMDKHPKTWGEEINSIFDKFKEKGITVDQIKARIQEVPLTPGMEKVFEFIEAQRSISNVDCIIDSGANMLYVKWVIEKYKLNSFINNYYSFACEDKDGKLQIGPRHTHDCKLCSKFMCKTIAIQEFLAEKTKDQKDFKYNKIFYFGDGTNDYCAGRNLQNLPFINNTYLFVRKQFQLEKLLFNSNGSPNDYHKRIKSDIFLWDNGLDLLDCLKKVL